MTNRLLNRFFLLFISSVIFISSCSSDDGDNSSSVDDNINNTNNTDNTDNTENTDNTDNGNNTGDNNTDNTNLACSELPESYLGVYTGSFLSDNIESDTFSNIGETFVTLSKSGDKTYTIDFDYDNIDSITDIQFFAAPDTVEGNVFSTLQSSENRGFGVNLIYLEANRFIAVALEIGEETVIFSGGLVE